MVAAVLAAGCNDVRDAVARAEAVSGIRGSADFVAVSGSFKRMRNILEQAGDVGEGAVVEGEVPEQRALREAAEAVHRRTEPLIAERRYREALEQMGTLRPEIDAFFDRVMVMDPDLAVRAGRLRLLGGVVRGFAGVADFSEMVGAG